MRIYKINVDISNAQSLKRLTRQGCSLSRGAHTINVGSPLTVRMAYGKCQMLSIMHFIENPQQLFSIGSRLYSFCRGLCCAEWSRNVITINTGGALAHPRSQVRIRAHAWRQRRSGGARNGVCVARVGRQRGESVCIAYRPRQGAAADAVLLGGRLVLQPAWYRSQSLRITGQWVFQLLMSDTKST